MIVDPVHLTFDALVALLRKVFVRHGCSENVAAIIAANMAMAERDGARSHGIFRVPGYLASLRSFWVDGRAVPTIEDVAPGLLRVDAHNGFCQPALAAGSDFLVKKTQENGIALLAIRDSHHFGALWPDVEPFARQGFVALSMVNSFACVVPHGGHQAVYGTNPIAFGAPRQSGEPLVFDQATSAMANGEVQMLAREGTPLPPGAGVDRDGRPTTDAQAVLDGGALLTFGGYKGSSISMMIEILSAALTGGDFSFEVDWSNHLGAVTPKSGQLLILIDPARGATRPFVARLEQLVARLRAAGQERLPGDRRHAARQKSLRDGIALAADDLARIERLARA